MALHEVDMVEAEIHKGNPYSELKPGTDEPLERKTKPNMSREARPLVK
jgi:hypothetical protein